MGGPADDEPMAEAPVDEPGPAAPADDAADTAPDAPAGSRRDRRDATRRRWVIAVVAAVVVLGGASLAWGLTRDDGGSGSSATATTRRQGSTTTTTVAGNAPTGSATTTGSGANPDVVPGPVADDPTVTTLPIAQGVEVVQSPGACRYDPVNQELVHAGTITNRTGDAQTVSVEVTWLGPSGEELGFATTADSLDHGQTSPWDVSTGWASDDPDNPDAPPPAVHCVVAVS